MQSNSKLSNELIRSLMRASVYDHSVKTIKLIETHISWVILTGTYAYKIKKPCNLGFLDFSTLTQRRFFCREELRLNKRLAAPFYLDIVAITGSPAHPVLQGTGDAIEYALKMVQFPQNAQLDIMLEAGMLGKKHIDAFAHLLAEFHQNAAIAAPDTCFGNPEQVYQPVTQAFKNIRACPESQHYSARITELENWGSSFYSTHNYLFGQRKQNGFIRECHGDLHLRNLLWLHNKPFAFDCLEFDPNLRWIDTLSDISFLVMDLQDRKQPQLALRFLNAYLEHSGDYSGLRLFRFYLVYRAVIRAMVAAIRAGQAGISIPEKNKADNECHAYLTLAQSYICPKKPVLIILHGFSASGKSTLSQLLLECIGAMRIRSDVERKRIFGLLDNTSTFDNSSNNHLAHKWDESPPPVYSQEANSRTYKKLSILAKDILEAGFSVIIDAAFLKFEERHTFLKLAQNKQMPFIILSLNATADTLRRRIRTRPKGISDADISVLEHQLKTSEPLHKDELPYLITVNTEENTNLNKLTEAIRKKSCN
ncbi:bifunctional aminoglycoside phosphotransferase/ATP-binding protein [Nitrosomonas sp.]|uniref:bifunctional aminoglycoside phosphotransferase/ATP-binding protein n=1 Tax=Nitrosomonas sp. TaxID=42353 RepID=UPI0025DB2C57|nr:bifunctional aminoglycoside phosphotransferase/ATP-binding protein [Nitrosomonas sp.]